MNPLGRRARKGPKASIFENARNTRVKDSTFNITTNIISEEQQREALDILYKRAAPNAILNAGGRADEVRCHPGTREEVIDRIEKWRDAQDSQTSPIFWLSGPAGAGKSAIVQTIAERCEAQKVPQANFFFFRTDTSRNSLSPLVATLVHQIALLHQALRGRIVKVLLKNPLILDATLTVQLTQLVVIPLQAMQRSSSSYIPPLLLIDGLDECDSAEKHNQRQILQAFDTVLMDHACPFRLLVASRDESQIRAAFNNISSQLLPLYLDGEYSPERDIRLFVNDEFKRVRKTHPLGHTLDKNWPPLADVEDIVNKSSGHFIYAATVLRFIKDSSASPKLSLAMVKGATAIIGTKSPFAQLDAIYTYILSQAIDHQAVKDILHAHFFLQKNFREPMDIVDLLRVYSNPDYTQETFESCLADLTPILRWSTTTIGGDDVTSLSFYHASFSDYLLDQSRSQEYFVDIDEFDFKLQPPLWKEFGLNRQKKTRGMIKLTQVALPTLWRLRRFPDGFLDVLSAVDPSCFVRVPLNKTQRVRDIFVHIYNLCASDDDVEKYKHIMRRWVNTELTLYLSPHSGVSWLYNAMAQRLGVTDHTDWPPYCQRYLAMDIKSYHITVPHDWIDTALRPETERDASEIAQWLSELLRGICEYRQSAKERNMLFREWTSWAIQNGISLDGVNDLPNIQWYCAMAKIDRNVTINVALQREKDCDISETAVWLTTLLHRIHGEKYHSNVQEYNKLLQKWTSWATQNDIPLDGVDDLPNIQWYRSMAKNEHDLMTNVSLHREKDCDVGKTAEWLTTLLHRIHAEKYRTSFPEYNQLIRKWTSWAILNDIPLNELDGLPNVQWYRAMAKIDRDVMINISLHREKECDVVETAVWLSTLLRRIHGEKYRTDLPEYNQLIRKWMSWAILNDISLHGVDDLPNVRWYRAMAEIEHNVTIDISLDRENDCDVSETVVWLTTLLHRIHREKYHASITEYNQLMRKWTSWATSNAIPLDGVDDLPRFQRYHAMAHVDQIVTTQPHGWIGIALRPETSSDIRETDSWLTELLHRIHKEKHCESDQAYNLLLRKWISWATRNNIPLDGVDGLPKARWYLRRSKIEKWLAKHLRLGSRPE